MKNRYNFCIIILVLTLLSGCQVGVNKPAVSGESANSWLEEMTITELQQGYKEGKYTVAEVVSAYLERFE